jgi:hypothetical protein
MSSRVMPLWRVCRQMTFSSRSIDMFMKICIVPNDICHSLHGQRIGSKLSMAEAASRSRVPLSPLSESHLNCSISSSKKRKHVDDAVEDRFPQPFIATVSQELASVYKIWLTFYSYCQKAISRVQILWYRFLCSRDHSYGFRISTSGPCKPLCPQVFLFMPTSPFSTMPSRTILAFS